jgi:hypothetical protein
MRRSIGLLALGLAVLAGCSTDSPNAPEPTATTPADPVAAVRDAMTKSLASTVHIDGKVGSGPETIEFSGDVDPEARVIKLTGRAPEPLEMVGVDDVLYIKQDEPGSKPWLRIDMRKLKPTSELRQSLDIRSQTGILAGVVSAENVAPGRYRGVADLHKAAAAAPESAQDSLKAAAKVAKNASAVAFNATVDAEGRLTGLTYTMETPAGPVATEMTLGRFGEPVTVTPPPDDQVEVAPEELYEIL